MAGEENFKGKKFVFVDKDYNKYLLTGYTVVVDETDHVVSAEDFPPRLAPIPLDDFKKALENGFWREVVKSQ